MEAALLSGFIKAIVPKLASLASERYKLHKGLKDDIRFLEKELVMIHAAIDRAPPSWAEQDQGGGVLRLSIDELRELAHLIEDCIDRFIYHATRDQQASSIRRAARFVKTARSRLRLATELQLLRKIPEEAKQRKERYREFAAGESSSAQMEEASSSASDLGILDTDPVGIDVPRDEIEEQLAEVAEGQTRQLKVISIVGFSGSGKTVLAREVYNSEVGRQFSVRAWVCATDRDTRKVLKEILHELGRPVMETSEVSLLIAGLREFLDKKRYLIVIDDMRPDQWITMESAFPGDNDVSSRVMVTTTLQSVANVCSSANGYVHKMRRLGKEHSEQLFFKKACSKEYLGYKGPDSTEVLKKCDGQPLALVTVGQFLRKKGWPAKPDSEDVCWQLGQQLDKDDTLGRMQRVLTQSYENLTGHAPKACLLYFSVFPSNHPVRRKSLMRRWLAEGFVGTQGLSCENFDNLIDRNIIEPIDMGKNDKVKTCQTYGMMREFILHKSTSQNFNTLLCAETVGRKYVRRLSLNHSSAADTSSLDVDLSLVRSLTIFGEAGKAVSEFQKYQLLRVLDLEECTDLGDDHLKYICHLLLLKYLSLGSTVTTLPKEIAKLKLLETLDLRRTNVGILPIEVILLPCLIHLFGKFQISDEVKSMTKLKKFFSSGGQFNLETLAGFITDQSQGFPQIMSHMKKLRKVKIWCERTASSTNLSDLKHAIQNFIHDEKEKKNEPRSLSLHLDAPCEGLLTSLKAPCYLRTLKLQGKLLELPQFVTYLRGLRELCISSSKLTTALLEALSELRDLQYLKLTADQLGEFIIKDHAFPKLVRICFVLRSPTLPKIEEGALSHLLSLQLICKDIVGLGDMRIKCLRCIREVILHPGVTKETSEAWKNAAKEHPNRPKILLLQMIDPTESKPIDISVDSEPAESETAEACVVIQSSSNDELNSDFGCKEFSESPLCFAELPIAGNVAVPSYTH